MKIAGIFALCLAVFTACQPATTTNEITESIDKNTLRFVDVAGNEFVQILDTATGETELTIGNLDSEVSYLNDEIHIDTVFDAENPDIILFVDTIKYTTVNQAFSAKLDEQIFANLQREFQEKLDEAGLQIQRVNISKYSPEISQFSRPTLQDVVYANLAGAELVELVLIITNGTQSINYPLVLLEDVNREIKK